MIRKTTGKAALLLVLVGLLVLALAAGCGGSAATSSSVKMIKSGTLQMGSDTTYPPFENMQAGKPVGFDVDIATDLAKRLGLKLQVVSTTWDDIIPRLRSSKFDILMSAMPITPDRAKEITFSTPYIDSEQSIAVVKGSPIKTQADLKDKVVGVETDSTGQLTAEKMQGLKEIRKFNTILLAFEALEQGKVDAIVNDYPRNQYLSNTRGKTVVVQTIPTGEKYGIGIKLGNTALVNAINKALADQKADGTYAGIYKKWFGKKSTTPASPSSATQ